MINCDKKRDISTVIEQALITHMRDYQRQRWCGARQHVKLSIGMFFCFKLICILAECLWVSVEVKTCNYKLEFRTPTSEKVSSSLYRVECWQFVTMV